MPFGTDTALLVPEVPRCVMLHGRWDAGKTFMALTMAEDYPPLPWQPKVPPDSTTVLKKTALVMWEKGTSGVAEAAISPAARIKLYETQPQELVQAVAFAKAEMLRLNKELGITDFIHDSLTAFDVKNVHRWSVQVDKTNDNDTDLGDRTGGKEDDAGNNSIYRAALNTHIDYYNGALSVPGSRHVFICHSKAFEAGVRSKKPQQVLNATIKARAKGLDVNSASLGAALTGQAWDHYYRNCDIVAYVEKSEKTVMERGMPKLATVREVTLRQRNGVIARCRYAALADVEPADFRVLFTKIRNTVPPQPTAVAAPGVVK